MPTLLPCRQCNVSMFPIVDGSSCPLCAVNASVIATEILYCTTCEICFMLGCFHHYSSVQNAAMMKGLVKDNIYYDGMRIFDADSIARVIADLGKGTLKLIFKCTCAGKAYTCPASSDSEGVTEGRECDFNN